jgi:hypothetical protein
VGRSTPPVSNEIASVAAPRRRINRSPEMAVAPSYLAADAIYDEHLKQLAKE